MGTLPLSHNGNMMCQCILTRLCLKGSRDLKVLSMEIDKIWIYGITDAYKKILL